MKTARKPQPPRAVRRRVSALSLTARVERLEKQLLFPTPRAPVPTVKSGQRFVNLGADGKPTTGDHVAVYDSQTGLVWAVGPLKDGADLMHADAMKACAGLDLLGHKMWRAPTIQELLSIVDYDRCDPAVDPAHFKGPFGWTWSSTLAKAPVGFAWYVGLYGGHSDRDHIDYRGHARAVCAGNQLKI